MLRAAVAAGSEVGRKAKSYMDAGQLVPDAVVIGVAEERLARPDAKRGFILDGFPRTAGQAEALDRMLPKLGCALERCVALTVDENELVKRLLRRAELESRSDDNEASIRTRMREYRQKTEPLIAYYRARGVLREVDGLGEIEEVAKRIAQALDGAGER
jgi:adenylate kinase